MGFFDRSAEQKPEPVRGTPDISAGGVLARLVAARELLETKDLPAALKIYTDILATTGDRPDVLVTISGDLGTNGHIAEIIDLVAPRYDAQRHGPATGINLLQAYLVARDAGSAQHILDILFALKRPELEERLYGFSNAIAELIQSERVAGGQMDAPPLPEPTQVNLVSISKPIWFYGLEPMTGALLPAKGDRMRRVAFAQLSVLGLQDSAETAKQPEDELGRLSRGFPLWLAETFYFSPHYDPIAAIGLHGPHYALFGAEWTTDNLRQLVDTAAGLDYIFTGALRQKDGDYELLLRVWEVKKFRERKRFTTRWTSATADEELGKLHEQIRLFMEWSPETAGVRYSPPASPRRWVDTLACSLSLFLGEKNLLPKEQLVGVDDLLAHAADAARTGEAASLAFLTLRNRAERLSLAARLEAALAASPLIAQAKQGFSG